MGFDNFEQPREVPVGDTDARGKLMLGILRAGCHHRILREIGMGWVCLDVGPASDPRIIDGEVVLPPMAEYDNFDDENDSASEVEKQPD